ncbi:hypothetical protein ACWPKO_19900 (plasmid) [Coraliomargarita sp. W4R53]
MTRPVTPLLAIVVLAVSLTGCTPDAPEPTATTAATETPVATPTGATPTETAQAVPIPAALPADCSEVGTAASRADTVDTMTLQGDGVGFVRPSPASAKLALGCDWIVGDATGILLLIYNVDAAEAATYVETLPAEGYACTTDDAGNPVCQMTTTASNYPVDIVETITSREGVWIYSSASNIDADALLSDLDTSIWPAP